MSFDRRGRPLLCHNSCPEQFLQDAKCHSIFDPFIFRPLTTPATVKTLEEALGCLYEKKTSGPSPYVFSSTKTQVSGALLATTISFGSMQRILIEDVILVSNPRVRHAVANAVENWLSSMENTVEVWFWGCYNDAWKNALIQEYGYTQHRNGLSIFTTNA